MCVGSDFLGLEGMLDRIVRKDKMVKKQELSKKPSSVLSTLPMQITPTSTQLSSAVVSSGSTSYSLPLPASNNSNESSTIVIPYNLG